MARDNQNKPENTGEADSKDETNTNPSAPAVNPKDLEKREAELAKKEKAAQEALDKVAEAESRVDEKLAEMDAKIAELTRDAQKDLVTRTTEEKAALVTRLQNEAYAGQKVGELQDYTPLVTLANITQAGVIVYEKGITYEVPKAIVTDLRRRESEHLDYKENLHVRREDIMPSGTISGGGK